MKSVLPVLVIYSVIVVALIGTSITRTGGVWIYPLDDTYIHLAIARNMVEHGTWGVIPGAYAPVSSSPLYTLLLTLLWKIRPWLLWPLVINVVAGGLFLVLINRAIPLKSRGKTGLLIALLFGIPLPLVAVLGMEHTLHSLVMVWILLVLWRWQHTRSRRDFRLLLALAVIAGGLRYESLFMGAGIGLMLISMRRFRDALWISLAFSVVPLLYGGLNLANGWPFLPSTLLVKAPPLLFHRLWERAVILLLNTLNNARLTPEIVSIAIGLVYLAMRWKHAVPRAIAATVLIQILLHYALARVGWFMRYEAYLIAMGLAATGLYVLETMRVSAEKEKPLALLVLAGVGLVASVRSLNLLRVPWASWDIYALPYQSVRVIQNLPASVSPALWDIGLPGLLTDRNIVDLAGLASREITRLRSEGRAKEIPGVLAAMDRPDRPVMGLVYDNLFPYAETSWVRVGFWEIPRERWVVTGGYRMSVYAVTPENAPRIRKWFETFAREKGFPEGVQWYTVPP